MTARLIVGPLKLVTRKLTPAQWRKIVERSKVKR